MTSIREAYPIKKSHIFETRLKTRRSEGLDFVITPSFGRLHTASCLNHCRAAKRF